MIRKHELPFGTLKLIINKLLSNLIGRDVIDKDYYNKCGFYYYDRDTCLKANMGTTIKIKYINL